MENVNKITAELQPPTSGSTETIDFEGLFKECGIKPVELNMESDSETSITLTNAIIAENLECSSTDSFSCGNDQNIFTTDFTYKNPVFLQMRINKYEDDRKKCIKEQEALEAKLLIQKTINKEILSNTKDSKQLKEMMEFQEIYYKPQMKIPKLIFERFMVDYDNEECPVELKQFAAEVYSRSPDAYDYMRKCFTNVLPHKDDLQELLKEIRSDDLSDDE